MTPHNTPRASLDRSQTQRVTTNNNHELDGIEMVALQRGLGLDLEAQAVEHDNEGEPVLYCRGRLALVLSLWGVAIVVIVIVGIVLGLSA